MSECRVKKIHLKGNNLWSLSGGVWVKMLIKVYNDGDYVYPISWHHRKKWEIIVKTGKHSSGLITWSGLKCFHIVVTQLTPNSACPQ